MQSRTRARVAALADPQSGVVSSAQLAAAGVDPELPRRAGWSALAPAVWSTTGEPDDEQLLVAARLYAPRGRVTGALACRRLLLDDVPDVPGADVLVPHGTRLRGSGHLRVHQTTHLPRAVRRKGFELAPPARAAVDAARWVQDLRCVRALLLGVLQRRYVTREQVAAEIGRGGRCGRAVLDRVLRDWDRGARSAPEAEAADVLLQTAGMPPFLLNPTLFTPAGFLGTPDGYVPGLGIGWEVDSLRHHGSSEQLGQTLDRHATFDRAGIVLVHVVPARLRRDPVAWARGLAATVAARAASGGTDPPGLAVRGSGPLLRGRSR